MMLRGFDTERVMRGREEEISGQGGRTVAGARMLSA